MSMGFIPEIKLCYAIPLICVLTTVLFVSKNCIYTTAELVKCCLYVCYVQIKASHLPTYFDQHLGFYEAI